MTRTLLLTTVLALALPLAPASAQTKCGPEVWSTATMSYTSAPCVGGEVGTAGPTARGSNSSTTMTKAEQKGMVYGYAPMPSQAVATGPGYAPMADQCGPSNRPAITDEYGRKYNCRGDRIR